MSASAHRDADVVERTPDQRGPASRDALSPSERATLVLLGALAVVLASNGLLTLVLGRGAVSTGVGAVKDVLLAVLVVLAALALQRGGQRPCRWFAGVLVLLAVLMALGVAAGVRAGPTTAALYGWRNDYEPLLLLAAVPVLATTGVRRQLAPLLAGTAQVAATVSVLTWLTGLSFLERLFGAPPYEPAYFMMASVRPRAFAPYVGPNEMAAATCVVVAFIACRGEWTVRRRATLCVLPVVAVLLSQSRSGALGLAVLAVTLAARAAYQRSRRVLLLLVVACSVLAAVVVATYAALVGIDISLVGHAASLQEATSRLAAHPLGGDLGSVGPRAERFVAQPVLVESFVLLLAIEAGVLALVAYLALLVVVAVAALRRGTLEAFTAVAALAAVSVSQLVLPTMQEGPVSFLVWIVVGLGVAASAPLSPAVDDARRVSAPGARRPPAPS